MEELIPNLFIGFFLSFFFLLFAGWVLGIPVIIRHLRAQTRLLIRIAEKQEVDDYNINQIKKDLKDSKV